LLSGQPGLTRTLIGVAAWGAHMGLTQGVLSAMVGVAAPQAMRGSAFGLFNLMIGVATIASSSLAGFLWQALGPSATFEAGAAFSVAAGLATLGLSPWLAKRS
jgi:MFS family permease